MAVTRPRHPQEDADPKTVDGVPIHFCELSLDESLKKIDRRLGYCFDRLARNPEKYEDFKLRVQASPIDPNEIEDAAIRAIRDDGFRYSLGLHCAAMYMLCARRFLDAGDEVKAWACFAESRYWLGSFDFGIFDHDKLMLLDVYAESGRTGGQARARKYGPVRELIEKSIKEDVPRNGWRSKREFADAFAKRYLKHPKVSAMYGEDARKLVDAVQCTFLRSGTELHALFGQYKPQHT